MCVCHDGMRCQCVHLSDVRMLVGVDDRERGEELQREVNEEGESDEDADWCSDCVDGGATPTWRSVSQRMCHSVWCILSSLHSLRLLTVDCAQCSREREGE